MSESTWVLRPGRPRLLQSWLARHQHPFSLSAHLVGIPLTIAAVPFLFQQEWSRAVGLFAGGYAAQFLGHAVEGNPPGELIALKHVLRLD